jgi:hypothetical protein
MQNIQITADIIASNYENELLQALAADKYYSVNFASLTSHGNTAGQQRGNYLTRIQEVSGSNLFWGNAIQPHFIVVVVFEYSRDPEIYAGGSVATGRGTHARQIKDRSQTKRDTLVLQVGGWAWG